MRDLPRDLTHAPTCLEVSVDPSALDGDDELSGDWCRTITTLRLVVPETTLVRPDDFSRIMDRLPALRAVTCLQGEAPEAGSEDRLVSLHEACRRRAVGFAVGFVLNRRCEAGAAIAGKPNPMTRMLQASRTLRRRNLPVQWRIPLLKELVFQLETLYSLAVDERCQPILDPAPEEGLESDERLFVGDFITYRVLAEERLTPSGIGFYEALRSTLMDDRAMPPAPTVAVLRTSDGLRGELRFPRGSLPWPEEDNRTKRGGNGVLRRGMAHARDVGGVLLEGSRGLLQWVLSRGSSPPRLESFSRALLIGAYGGEHIGDAAILGGVLLRIKKRYGTTHAILLSQRPAHTRHLVSMLEVLVTVEVRPYEHAAIRDSLGDVDAVVYAGGPLTDLPKQLVRHLYAVSLARRQGKPFVMEGIGAGPFVRRPSTWVGRRILKMAQRVAVRTADDGRQPLLRDLHPVVGCDPAFDYLETRPPKLTRLPEIDRLAVERLLRGAEGRPVIAINLRPIRHLYTVGKSGQDPAEYTRAIESRFEERVAEALTRFDQVAAPKPLFVFYPMNAIQFGLSDLRSAYHVRRLLGSNVDFRVWEGDATLDGVVELLRRVDLIIAMRFHAAIFALSQRRPVIGIDYRIGKRDKVAALLADFDQSANCTRIDELTADWLFERVRSLAAPIPCSQKESVRCRFQW